MNELKYISIDEQIIKLRNQGLIISDEDFARKVLDIHGYYNIVNGYREPYIFIDEQGKKCYRKGVVFEQIYDLFIFDQAIRDAIMVSMIDFEEHLKTVTADIIGNAFGIDPTEYLARNNYRDKQVSNPKFSRNEILYTLTKNVRFSQKPPIKHYREKYGVVPPWILFKDTYFSTIVNLIRFFKKSERENLIAALYKSDISEDDMESYKNLLSDTLFMCLDYRNQTAHGGRIYSYIPKYTLRPFNNVCPATGLPQLVFALNMLNYKVPTLQIKQAISTAINDYCSRHRTSEDIQRIETVTGFKITHNSYVWVNYKTKKYHSDKYCSGSRDLQKIHSQNAIDQGFTPCKRCCK